MTVTDLPKLLDDVKNGHRLTDEEAVSLMNVRNRDVFLIASAGL